MSYETEYPLHRACQRGDIDHVKYLIDQKQMDPNLCNKYGFFPIHCASICNKIDCIITLVEKNCDINAKNKNNETIPVDSINNITGNTALHYAAFNGHDDCIDYLLKNKCDVNAINSNAVTALSLAKTYSSFKTRCINILTKAESV